MMTGSASTPAPMQEPRNTSDGEQSRLDPRLTSPARLAALRATGLLDGTSNAVLDRLSRLVTRLLGVPIATVSLVDDQGQHFPGVAGIAGWAGEQRGTPLSYSFCQHVVTADATLLVNDATAHPLVQQNPAVSELGVVAYAGVPLRTAEGLTLGALCAIDSSPVQWTPEQVAILEDLAAAAMAEIELRSTIRSLVAMQVKLQSQVSRDELTGLLNRRGFMEQAKRHLALAERTDAPFLVAALDLDGFKAINDTCGHEAGDAALQEMAALLTNVCRASDIVARFGGDEFVLLLANSGVDHMHRVRERLHEAIERRNQVMPVERQMTSSIGIAVWTPKNPKSLALLQRQADEAMYADKRAGRARRTARSTANAEG
ncbi:MAG: sensor domain-containing diguanylate cyclase [Gemmatimonadota bacterium]